MNVTVNAAPESVKLNKTNLSLAKGKTEILTPNFNPTSAAAYGRTWTSSNPKAATVSAGGKVTAVAAGTTTITVKLFNGKIATCKVTVK